MTAPVWLIEAFVRSELPLTDRVCTVFQVTMVVFGDRVPSDPVIEALVMSHMKNVEFIGAMRSSLSVPDDLISDS